MQLMATTNQQMDELMSPDDMMMPQEDVTKERAVKAAKDVLTFGAESTPFLGEIIAAKRTGDAIQEKDYIGAAVEAAAGVLGIVPIIGDVAGRALRSATRSLRKDAKLTVDNPGYNKIYGETYAETKQRASDEVKKKALDAGETDTYRTNLGTTEGITGYANEVTFKPEELKNLPGAMGEEKIRSSGAKLENLKKPIKEEGYKPDTIMIHVREDGQPFIVEGNHRLAEALESGRETIDADIRYLRGAEEKAGPLDPRYIFPDKRAPLPKYNLKDPDSRVFHLTKKDYDTADVVGKGLDDIGFHVGTAKQASARGSSNSPFKEVREQLAEGERILPMVLKANLKPARIVDLSTFKMPSNWLANLSVDSSDRQIMRFLKGDSADSALLKKAPRVKTGGTTYIMSPDAMRAGVDPDLWEDLILEASRARRIGLDTINKREDRLQWFSTLKGVANKHGYDSFVYKNEYEGIDKTLLEDVSDQAQDSYMLLEADQAKGIFGGLTEGEPEFMKNRGGVISIKKGGVAKQMEMFEPVERGFNSGALVSPEKVDVTIFDFNEIANSYNNALDRSGRPGAITGDEMAALFDAFLDIKTAAKTSGMNEGGDSSSAKDAAMQDLQSSAADKKTTRKDQFDKLTDMLMSGEIKNMPEEEQQKFIKLYKMMQSQGFNEGGLAEEGGSVDPISGNSVPPGSTKEEVRDDIPAQLSEGEFVFPADVVRYIGLEKLMMMRQEAKMGLAAMEAMGQMGNSEEAIMPDDLPFDMYDLDIEDDNEYNMAQGGVVKMQQGGTNYTPPTIGGYTPPPPVTTGFSGPQPVQPFQSGQGQFQVAGAAEGAVTPKTAVDPVVPTFADFVGQNIPGVDFTMVTFYDENGQAKVLKKFPDGSFEDPANPGAKVNPADMGLTEEVKTETTPTQQRVETARVVEDNTGREEDDPSPSSTDVTGVGYSRSGLTSSLRDAIDKYGAGFGTLKDAFNTQSYDRIAKGLGLKEDIAAKTNAITSAAFGGVLDNFRGGTLEGGYEGPNATTALDQLGNVEQDRIASVARATIDRMSSLYTDEKGDARGQAETRDALEAAIADSLSKQGYTSGQISNMIEDIATAKGTKNYNINQRLSRHLGGIYAAEETQKAVDKSMTDYAAITSGRGDDSDKFADDPDMSGKTTQEAADAYKEDMKEKSGGTYSDEMSAIGGP